VRSILTSLNPSAYYVLWIKGLKLLFLPIDILLSLLEKPFLSKTPEMKFPVIFVVGIHRTGSTFVAQVLSDNLGCAPLGNYATIFPRSKILIPKLLKRFYNTNKKGKAKKYKSYYGISMGIFSIGDCYEVWDRWMGNDHYNRPENLTSKKKEKMANYLKWLQHSWGMPLITKNNRNSLVLKTIHKSVPNAFFVMVLRNPADVIQSTMQASRDFFGNDEIMWGLRPRKTFSYDNYKDKLDAYCHQYIDLEDSIRHDLTSLPEEDYYVVQYEGFCEDPEKIQNEIWGKIKAKHELPESSLRSRSLRHYTSKRLFDKEITSEINSRIKEIRNKNKEG